MMYPFKSISDKVSKIKYNYCDSNPFKLCKDMGIKVLYAPLGKSEESCKGFFLCQSRIRCITINENLSEDFQRIICAHELGHAVLHRDKTGIKAFHDFKLFDQVSKYEYEANIFAAELLLEDRAVLDSLNQDQSFFQAAAELYVPAELLDFKFRTLKLKGYKMLDAPIISSSNWLKNARDGGERE